MLVRIFLLCWLVLVLLLVTLPDSGLRLPSISLGLPDGSPFRDCACFYVRAGFWAKIAKVLLGCPKWFSFRCWILGWLQVSPWFSYMVLPLVVVRVSACVPDSGLQLASISMVLVNGSPSRGYARVCVCAGFWAKVALSLSQTCLLVARLPRSFLNY